MNATTIRRIAVPAALVLLVLLAIPLILRARGSASLDAAVENFEAQVGPLTMAAYQPAKIERVDNAGVWLMAAADATILSKLDRKLISTLRDRPVSDWRHDERRQLDRIVSETEAPFKLLERSLDLEESNFELNYSAGTEMPIPNFLSVLTTHRLVELKARRDLAAGDLDGFRQAALICARSARTLQTESILISQLVGLSVEQGFLALVHEAVAEGVADVELLAELKSATDGIDLNAMVRRSLGAEGSMLLLMDRKQMVAMLKNGHDREVPGSISLPAIDERSWVGRVLDQYRHVSTDLDRPFTEIHAQRSAAALSDDGASIEKQLGANFDDTVHRAKTIAGLRHLARTAIDVRLQALAANANPPSLVISEASPYTGQPLDYEVLSDGSARLSAEGAADVYLEVAPDLSRRAAPLFAWTLPAP